MAITKFNQYKLSTLLHDDDDTADTLKARFEGCPQLVSTGGSELARKVCNEAIRKGLVKPNDAIDYSYSQSRLDEIEHGYIKKQNNTDNTISPTLKANQSGIGICVNEPFIVASRGRNPENPSDRTTGCHTQQRLEPKFDGTTNALTSVQKDNYICIKNNTKKGYLEGYDGDGVYVNTTTKRGTVQHECSPTLTSFNDKGVIINAKNYRIRKLTPKECWRLQGFSDEDFEKAKNAGVSDAQLYKQAGNSITVNVLMAIVSKLNLDNNKSSC